MTLINTLAAKKEDPKKEARYFGVFRTLDSRATPIPLKDGEYKPTNADQVKCLEHLVSSGLITKE